MDYGANQIYFATDAHVANFDPLVPQVHVATAMGLVQQYSGTAEIDIPSISTEIPKYGQVMPSFAHTLAVIGSFCDADCTVTFNKDVVTIADPAGRLIVTGWCEPEGSHMWRISPVHNEDPDPDIVPGEEVVQATLDAFSTYNLPSGKALIRYFHTSAGFPVQYT